jgi:hypothetical protein
MDTDGRANTWADGTYRVVGQDSFDFDSTVKGIDHTHQAVARFIHQVPSQKSQIKLPAPVDACPRDSCNQKLSAGGKK